MSENILVLGAGAVGQVYGHIMQRAGARVCFMVRPKYEGATRAGFTLHPLRMLRSPAPPERFVPDDVFTTCAQIAQHDWDQVWLCIPSTGFSRDWFSDFARSIKHATVIGFGHSPGDHAFFQEHLQAEQIVAGLIGFIAYEGPLEDERVPGPGMLYWLPPGSPSCFDSPDRARLDGVLSLLRRGGYAVKHEPGIQTASAFPTAVLMPFLVALELEGWKLRALKKSALLKTSVAATKQAAAAIAKTYDLPIPALLSYYSPLISRGLVTALPPLVPLPMQTYLAYHFTKVGAQTRHNIQSYIDLCRTHDLPHTALTQLHEALQKHDLAAQP